MPGEAVAAERAVNKRMNRRATALRTLTQECERMSRKRAVRCERVRAFVPEGAQAHITVKKTVT